MKSYGLDISQRWLLPVRAKSDKTIHSKPFDRMLHTAARLGSPWTSCTC